MSLTPEEAQRLADEYQKKVLAHLLSILPITGSINADTSSNPTTNNEEEPPRSRFN